MRAHLTAAAGVHGSRPSLEDIYLRLTDHDGHLFPVVIIAIFGALFRGAGGSSYFYGLSALHYYVPTIAAIPVPGSCYSQLAIVLLTWRQNGILKRVRATPLPAWTYFLGLLAHRIMVSAVDVALQEPSSPSAASAGPPDPNNQFSIRRKAMCPHLPACPPADRPDRDAARSVASHPEQGWSLLCNGVIVFDDLGEILPGGRMVPPHRLVRCQPPVAA